MRRSRVTFKGAYHHIMSRGLNHEPILAGREGKEYFLRLLREAQKIYRIRLLVYCLMDNHYHLILQNSSARLADFMRYVNGYYGLSYRSRMGGRGYVFQDRYKSTLIQQDNYLTMAVVYVLLNPVRAGVVKDPYRYPWSSIGCYFSGKNSDIVDNVYVEDFFGSRIEFRQLLAEWLAKDKELPLQRTRFGDILGAAGFIDEIAKRFDRRHRVKESFRMRHDDYTFEPSLEVIRQFERANGVRLVEIDATTHLGMRLRAKLLVLLRERAGLRYKEIIKIPLFRSLKYSSLGKLYKRTKAAPTIDL